MVVNKLKQMLTDDSAISPVIGIILMVAVTVVLAAVIGVFVFGIGDSLGDPAPSTQVEFDYDDGDDRVLTVSHDGGETLTDENTGNLTIAGDYDVAENPLNGEDFIDWEVGEAEGESGATTTNLDESVSSGEDIVQIAFEDSDGHSVSLQWESVDGGQSSTLGTFETP